MKKYGSSGFSMVEILIAFAMLGMLSVVVMKLMEDMTKGEKRIQNKSEMRGIDDEVNMKFVQSSKACQLNLTAAFNGQSIDNEDGVGSDIFNILIDRSGSVLLEKGIKKFGKIEVVDLEYSYQELYKEEFTYAKFKYTGKAKVKIVLGYCNRKRLSCAVKDMVKRTYIKSIDFKMNPNKKNKEKFGLISCDIKYSEAIHEANSYTDTRILALEQKICLLQSTILGGAGTECSLGLSTGEIKTKVFDLSKETFIIPEKIIKGTLAFRILGAGGGGSSGKTSLTGCGGSSGQYVDFSAATVEKRDQCVISVGQGGEGSYANEGAGKRGGSTSVECSHGGKVISSMVSSGGRSGSPAIFGCSGAGAAAIFDDTLYIGGGFDKSCGASGKNGKTGAGGSGGGSGCSGQVSGEGGAGGDGLVHAMWFENKD
jgi:hypothetical protein